MKKIWAVLKKYLKVNKFYKRFLKGDLGRLFLFVKYFKSLRKNSDIYKVGLEICFNINHYTL